MSRSGHGDDAGERLGQYAFHALVTGDEDSLEERLVIGAAQCVGCAAVGLVAVLGEGDRVVEVLFQHFELGLQGAEPVADDGHLRVDPFLFLSVELARDIRVEVGVEQLLAALHQSGLLGEEQLLRPLGFGRSCLHPDLQPGLGHRCSFGGEFDELVEVFDLPFDVVDVGADIVQSVRFCPRPMQMK